MAKEKILFVLTGGTIDSYYEGTKDTAVTNEHSAIPRFIKSLKLYEEFDFIEVCMKDSRDLIASDLKQILKTVDQSALKKVVITQGTYTLGDTARYLEANLKKKNKTIVLTASMIPLVGFSPSDAPFCLGFAIAKLHDLKEGVYVCMNGKVFSPVEVVKTLSEGRFSSIFNNE